jgi:hypothetical protein
MKTGALTKWAQLSEGDAKTQAQTLGNALRE